MENSWNFLLFMHHFTICIKLSLIFLLKTKKAPKMREKGERKLKIKQSNHIFHPLSRVKQHNKTLWNIIMCLTLKLVRWGKKNFSIYFRPPLLCVFCLGGDLCVNDKRLSTPHLRKLELKKTFIISFPLFFDLFRNEKVKAMKKNFTSLMKFLSVFIIIISNFNLPLLKVKKKH